MIKQIIEGHMKLIRNKDLILKDLSQKRLRHCNSCNLYNGITCSSKRFAEHLETGDQTSGCGCNMVAKVLVYNVDCPLAKWKAHHGPEHLIVNNENWMKVTKNEYTNGDQVLVKKDGTWYYEDGKNSTAITSYDELVDLINE